MKISWTNSCGGSMGPNTLLKLDDKYVGHLYVDASEGVDADKVLADIAARYNVHDALVAALEEACDHIRSCFGTDDRPDSDSADIVRTADAALAMARKGV